MFPTTTSSKHASPWLIEPLGAPMNHAQNQDTPLLSLMAWDQDGELCSEDLDNLLARFLAQELSQQKQEQAAMRPPGR